MPTGIHDVSTGDLIQMIWDTLNTSEEQAYTINDCIAELQSEERLIPNDYTDVALRGGIRPTRPSL